MDLGRESYAVLSIPQRCLLQGTAYCLYLALACQESDLTNGPLLA
jgi:hypothetical protein